MLTTKGTIICVGPRFAATFIIGSTQCTYTGHLNPSARPFNVTDATLTYDSTADLRSTHPFSGRVGNSTVTINISNGVVATGHLDNGEVDPSITFEGSGFWSVN
jgi:hypothetical protein